MKLACNAGNERCLSDTFNVNRHFTDDDHPIPKGLEGVVLCSGFRGTGKQPQWNELLRRMQITTDATFKSQALNALGCSDDPVSLKDYLESTLDESFTYTQVERRNILSAVLNSRSGLSAVINFVRDFELEIIDSFGYVTLEEILEIPARTIKTRAQETTFVNFIQTLTHLEETNSTRITTIIDNNFQVQQQTAYAQSMEFIRLYLIGDPEPSPTDEPTTNSPPTNTPTTNPPVETTTPSAASSINLSLATLFASLFIIFHFKI